jgi:hypothetical protein
MASRSSAASVPLGSTATLAQASGAGAGDASLTAPTTSAAPTSRPPGSWLSTSPMPPIGSESSRSA